MPLTEPGDNKPESELVGSCPAISRDMWRLPPANYNDGSESRGGPSPSSRRSKLGWPKVVQFLEVFLACA